MVPCPRRRLRDHTAGLLSRRWTLRIVIALSTGVKRRSELSRLLPGVTQKVLTETLREMERTEAQCRIAAHLFKRIRRILHLHT